MYNWNTLNGKVFKRMGFGLSKAEFEAAANCQVCNMVVDVAK
jgi:hypothetical protein